MSEEAFANRPRLLRRGVRLEVLTVGWNLLEGAIAVGAALASGSVALLAFGADSFIETASGGILIWRLTAEARTTNAEAVEALDRRAHKLVGASLLLLAVYVAVDAAWTLWIRERPSPSIVGMVLTAVSLVVMVWLAGAKRGAARGLGSRALEADAFQTTACWWLSLITLSGIGLNAAFGWWWADPVAALGMTFFLVQEGREAWRGEACCGRAAMKHKWVGAVLVFGAATGLIIWRELRQSPAASPAPAAARLVLYADLSEVDEAEGCGAIIRGVREAARLGVATEEIDARKPSDRLPRYKLLVAPSVIFLGEAGREVKRYEGEAPDTVRAILERIRSLLPT